MRKDKNHEQEIIEELTITEEQFEKVDEMLRSSNRGAPNFWDESISETIYVPVDDGEIKILHVRPEKSISKRPIVFIPGWGVIPAGFQNFYDAIHGFAELYYIETREKGSSKLNKKKAKMDMSQKAKDLQDAIEYLGLDKDDFLLISPCWGATVILQGLLDGTIKAPMIIVFDPMHKLWFNRFLLKYVSPILPVFVVRMLKRIIGFFALLGMKEKTQKQRAKDFIKNAHVWKWKKAAERVRDLELIGKLSGIKEEVLVFNGTTDRIHEQKDYPAMAKELPNGRFFFMKTDESNRERLMGVVTLEFCQIKSEDGIPPVLAEFEKELRRSESMEEVKQ